MRREPFRNWQVPDRDEGRYPDERRSLSQNRYDDRRMNNQSGRGDVRGWWDRTADEVSSWLGDEETGRRHTVTNRIYKPEDRNQNNSQFRSYSENRENRNRGITRNYNSSERNRWRDWHDTRASDLMTRNVATVHRNDTAQQAARIMRDYDCGAIPVVDRENRMIGMVTDRDITIRLVASGADPRFAQVGDCMTDEVFSCHEDDRVEDCMRAMSEHQVRRMPIVDDRNRVLGIISQGDLARHAAMNPNKGERRAVANMIGEVSEPSYDAYR